MNRKELIEAMIEAGTLSLHKCPVTGKVIEGERIDDKVFCPYCLAGIHSKAGLKRATVDEYIRQWESKR